MRDGVWRSQLSAWRVGRSVYFIVVWGLAQAVAGTPSLWLLAAGIPVGIALGYAADYFSWLSRPKLARRRPWWEGG